FDLWPTLATDGAGNWDATWQTRHTFLFEPGEDLGDVYAARSTDNGSTWSAPTPISTGVDIHDFFPEVVAAEPGVFVIAWMSYDLSAAVPNHDIRFSRSVDGGATWSAPATLNSDAGTAADVDKQDTYPTLARDGARAGRGHPARDGPQGLPEPRPGAGRALGRRRRDRPRPPAQRALQLERQRLPHDRPRRRGPLDDRRVRVRRRLPEPPLAPRTL